MTEFDERVDAAVRTIPRGGTRSYGEVAEMAGSPGAARAVGESLKRHEFDSDVPWWRVVRSDGTFPGGDPQKVARVLLEEGVAFTNDGRVAGYGPVSPWAGGTVTTYRTDAGQRNTHPCWKHDRIGFQHTCRDCGA